MVLVARARPESVYYNNIYTHGVPNYTHFLRRKRYRTGKRSGTVYFDCLSSASDRLAKNKKNSLVSRRHFTCEKKFKFSAGSRKYFFSKTFLSIFKVVTFLNESADQNVSRSKVYLTRENRLFTVSAIVKCQVVEKPMIDIVA